MTQQALAEHLAAECAAFPCKVSLLMTDLESGATCLGIDPGVRVVAASTIKVPILLAALEAVRLGEYTLDQLIPVPETAILPDTQVFDRGVAAYSLWELLYWMIVESDNTATNVLLDALGTARVTAYAAQDLGLRDTLCQRKMLDWTAIQAGRNNYTSAADQCRMYRLLYSGEILTPPLRETALDILTRQRSMDLLLRYLPDPITLAHKTGGLDYLAHDAGLFLSPRRPFFLGIFTWDGPSPEGDARQKQFIGRLGKAIYDTYKEA